MILWQLESFSYLTLGAKYVSIAKKAKHLRPLNIMTVTNLYPLPPYNSSTDNNIHVGGTRSISCPSNKLHSRLFAIMSINNMCLYAWMKPSPSPKP